MGCETSNAVGDIRLSLLLHLHELLQQILPLPPSPGLPFRDWKLSSVSKISCKRNEPKKLTVNSFYPATSAISEWFNKRRALALGMAVSGSSAGGILWPLVVNKLFTVVSEPWVHRINALISIPLLLVACFLVQERKGVAGHDTAGNEIKPSQTSFSKAVLDWRFFFLSIALFFIYCGMLVPFYYIPLYAELHGVSITMSNNLLAIAYSGSVCGRVATGWIADHVGR